MKLFLLAAGLGTRLRPVTDQIAKPAVPLLNVPLMHWCASFIRSSLGDQYCDELRSIIVNSHHRPESLVAAISALPGLFAARSSDLSDVPEAHGTGLRSSRSALVSVESPGSGTVPVLSDRPVPVPLEGPASITVSVPLDRPLPVHVSHESEKPLGAGGALIYARQFLETRGSTPPEAAAMQVGPATQTGIREQTFPTAQLDDVVLVANADEFLIEASTAQP